MASLKDLRSRIDAIKSTEKITSAMKMISASKLRHVQDFIVKGEDYRNCLYSAAGRVLYMYSRKYKENGQTVVLPQIADSDNSRRRKENYILIVLSSDKGLCGNYNVMVARKAKNRVEELKAAGKNVTMICYGYKAYNILRKEYAEIIVKREESVANNGVGYYEAEAVSRMLLNLYYEGDIDVCEIVYGKFLSALSRSIVSQQILPMSVEQLQNELQDDKVGDACYESEPDDKELLNYLLPLVFKEMIFDIMINSQASEQGARMTSMDNATRNAQEMTSKLKLKYNRLRQNAITTELTEIIAGAEAM